LKKDSFGVFLGDTKPNNTFMKATLLMASLICVAAATAFASDEGTKDAKQTKTVAQAATKEKAKTKQTSAVKKQEVVLTGSNIKREVRSDGQVTDAPNSLTVIDRKAIERSGVADLRQVLARQSGIR
jgi:outer membrane receptor for Fe3+-dicitrate